MVTERRVFKVKIGEAAAVVAKLKEAQPMLGKLGYLAGRIYTDYYSGQADRVVWEFDHESLNGLENLEQGLSQDAELLKVFESWFAALKPLIQGATVELWHREN